MNENNDLCQVQNVMSAAVLNEADMELIEASLFDNVSGGAGAGTEMRCKNFES